MPTNKNFDKRRLKLDEYLRNAKHPLTLDEITDALIVKLELDSLDKMTVQDDIKHFKITYGAPIKKHKIGEKTVWYYNDANFSVNKIPVEVDELLSLQKQ